MTPLSSRSRRQNGERFMKKIACVSLQIALVAGAIVIPAQAQLPSPAADTAAAERIGALSAALRFDADVPGKVELDTLTDQVRSEVRRFVENTIAPATASATAESRLRSILVTHQPNPEYADLAYVRVADLLNGRSLVAAYTLVRGPHHNIATIDGFAQDGERFRLRGSAGGDFVGYNMFKSELQSPVFGELWLMAWGQAQTFNGTKVRFRIYAFDGSTFRTVWSPDDMFNATLSVTKDRFAIEHVPTSSTIQLRDEYALTVAGPVKVN